MRYAGSIASGHSSYSSVAQASSCVRQNYSGLNSSSLNYSNPNFKFNSALASLAARLFLRVQNLPSLKSMHAGLFAFALTAAAGLNLNKGG